MLYRNQFPRTCGDIAAFTAFAAPFVTPLAIKPSSHQSCRQKPIGTRRGSPRAQSISPPLPRDKHVIMFCACSALLPTRRASMQTATQPYASPTELALPFPFFPFFSALRLPGRRCRHAQPADVPFALRRPSLHRTGAEQACSWDEGKGVTPKGRGSRGTLPTAQGKKNERLAIS